MKTILLMMTCIAGMCMLQSCEKDNDLSNPGGNKEVENSFNTLYPGATRVEWEKKGEYWAADFRKDNKEMEAWFTQAGVWRLTEMDILLDELPEAVKTAFYASEYKDWRIEDVDMIERKDMETMYVLELENGNMECDLYYSPTGAVVKTVTGSHNDDNGHYLPSPLAESVQNYITTYYPMARIVEIETERSMTEVDIIDGTVHRELLFSTDGEWFQTESDIAFSALPEAVKTVFSAGDYGVWRVDDVDMFEHKDAGTFYVLEVESGKQEYNLHYSPDGVLIKTVAD